MSVRDEGHNQENDNVEDKDCYTPHCALFLARTASRRIIDL
jgi:hypothetical protein